VTLWLEDAFTDEELRERGWDLEQAFALPCRYIVCPHCRGSGGCSCALGTFDAERFYELGDDFREDYMRGLYDQACEQCSGKRVEAVIDRDAVIRQFGEAVLAVYDRGERELADMYAEQAAERRIGA
jgi:hypothetical protein